MLCDTTQKQNGSVCSVLSGRATTTGKPFGSKMTLSKTSHTLQHLKSKQGFATFRLQA